MYKLLVTTALVAITATSASAFGNAEQLTQNLQGIYGGVEGNDEFKLLQQQTGALGLFLNEAAQGVTHVTLTNTNGQLEVGIKAGTTLQNIQTKASELVVAVNQDLFGNDVSEDYGIGNTNTDGSTDYEHGITGGLVGARITEVVGDINNLNDYLVAPGATTANSDTVVAAINGKTGSITTTVDAINGDTVVDVADLFVTVDGLNAAQKIIADDFGVNQFDGFGVNGANLNDFIIDGFTNYTTPVDNTEIVIDGQGIGSSSSLTNWALGIQTLKVNEVDYTYTGQVGDVLTLEGALVSINGETAVDPTTDAKFTTG